MKELFYELIDEACAQRIIIDGEEWPIGFNTLIYDEKNKIKYSKINNKNLNCLVIKDEVKFFKILEKYLNLERKINRKSVNFLDNSDKNKNKLILAYLFANAGDRDFMEPMLFIRRVIDYLEDTTFNNYNNGVNIELGNLLDNNILEIKNELQDVRMETPRKMSFRIKDKNDNSNYYDLPSIYYGITSISGQKECYIYSILNSRNGLASSFSKKINRKLYKVNKEAKREINYGINYDSDDLNLVTPSAVVALTIFINLLKQNNIEIVKGVSFLPVRYLSRIIALNFIENEQKREELFNRNIAIQNNATDKFLRTFRRISYNISDIEVLTDPYMGAEYITLKIGDKEILTNNDMLTEFSRRVNKR